MGSESAKGFPPYIWFLKSYTIHICMLEFSSFKLESFSSLDGCLAASTGSWIGSWQCDRVYSGFLQPQSKPCRKSRLSWRKPHSGATAAGGRYVPSKTPPQHRHAHRWTGRRLLHWKDLYCQVGGVIRSTTVSVKVRYICSSISIWFKSCQEVPL